MNASLNTSALVAMTLDIFEKFQASVALASGSRHTTQTRLAETRKALETNSEHVSKADALVEDFIGILLEEINVNPGVTGALYRAIVSKLSSFVKDERDMFVAGFDGSSLEQNTPVVDFEALDQMRAQIIGLVSVLETTGVAIPSELPTRLNKDGKTVLSLARTPKPRNTNRKELTSAIKKLVWTVDGVEYRGYSLRAMRKIVGASTVQEIVEAMDCEDRNFPAHLEFVFNGKLVTRSIAGDLSDSEASALSEGDDTDDDTED
jgi:hypothetical protein